MRYLRSFGVLCAAMVLAFSACSEPAKEKSGVRPAATRPATQPSTAPVTPSTMAATAPAKVTTQVVVTDADGKPMANVALELSACYMKTVTGTTDAQGRATMEVPEKARDGFGLMAKADGYVRSYISWQPASMKPLSPVPQEFKFKMEKGVAIGGRILDQDEKPIAGATVHIRTSRDTNRYEPVYNQQRSSSSETVKTDADGRWHVPNALPNPTMVEVGYYHPDYLTNYTFYLIEEYKTIPSLLDQTAVFHLKRGVPVTGTVVDPDGKPIAGAEVNYGTDNNSSNSIPAVKTDAEGKFEYGIQKGVNGLLMVKAKGFALATKSFVAGSDGPLVIKVAAPKTMTGEVVNIEGKSLAGVTVVVDEWNGNRISGPHLTTDKDGQFKWNEASDGTYSVYVMHRDYLTLREKKMEPGQKARFVLQRQPTFSGKVVDAETKQPIKEYVITEGIQWRADQNVVWQLGNKTGFNQYVKRTEDGGFVIQPGTAYPGLAYRAEADGYAPAETAKLVPADGDQTFVVELKKSAKLPGVLQDAEGKPLAGVSVTLVPLNYGGLINGDFPHYWNQMNYTKVTTDSEGRFALPPQAEDVAITVLRDDGYVYQSFKKTTFPATLKMTKWAAIKGTVKIGTKLAPAGTKISMWLQQASDDRMDAQYETMTDANGQYEFKRVIPGTYGVGRYVQVRPNSWGQASSVKTVAKAGETVEANIGGVGRPITGHITPPAELTEGTWELSQVNIVTDVQVEKLSPPEELKKIPLKERQAWFEKWRETDEGKAYMKKAEEINAKRKYYNASVSADNTFRAEDMPAGDYVVSATITKKRVGNNWNWEPLANASYKFTVPEIPGGVSDEPLDIGTVTFTTVKNVKVGDVAPEITYKDFDGKEHKLSEFRGKYVLVDFWATWCGPCVAETPNLKAVWEALGKNDKFAMLGLSVDEKVDEPRDYAKENGIQWVQGFLGEWNNPAAKEAMSAYGVQGIPSIWLIGPDGKVVAKDLRGEKMKETVEGLVK